jgi:hypothetical protein
MTQIYAKAESLTRLISDEVYKALGLSKDIWLRRFMEPFVERPTLRFAQICASFDYNVANFGFKEAANRILANFIQNPIVLGSETIPSDGPLLIVSNHPGTYDSLVIAANVPRNDLNVIAGNIPFMKKMPATQKHIIHTTTDTHDRMMVLRKAVRHLKSGGSLLIFGSGGIDPEPAYMDGAEEEIESWSPSIEFFIKKIPQLHSLVTIVSGVLVPKYLNHPLTIFRKTRRDKQRISEFIQVIQQMLSPGKLLLSPKVTFAEPVCIANLRTIKNAQDGFQLIKNRAKQLLAEHQIPLPNNS